MSKIGGRQEAQLQQRSANAKNALGERLPDWVDIATLIGFLDYTGGEARHDTWKAKTQETSHVFLCDYVPLDRFVDDKRMVIDGDIYDVANIDDPMGLHEHLEISLRYVGR